MTCVMPISLEHRRDLFAGEKMVIPSEARNLGRCATSARSRPGWRHDEMLDEELHHALRIDPRVP